MQLQVNNQSSQHQRIQSPFIARDGFSYQNFVSPIPRIPSVNPKANTSLNDFISTNKVADEKTRNVISYVGNILEKSKNNYKETQVTQEVRTKETKPNPYIYVSAPSTNAIRLQSRGNQIFSYPTSTPQVKTQSETEKPPEIRILEPKSEPLRPREPSSEKIPKFFDLFGLQDPRNRPKRSPFQLCKSNIQDINKRYPGYQILKKLGLGKYSEVYLAIETQASVLVALKVIKKQTIVDARMEDQLVHEIKIQYYIQHPCLVRAYTFFHTEQDIVYVMEYCDGGTLMEYVKQKPEQRLSEYEAAQYIKQMCQALIYLHNQEIIHRDLKPENILINQGQAKLADFSFSIYSPSQYRSTQCGTFVYLAPELTQGDLYDKSCDLWALGILAYELCAGDVPWRSQNKDQVKKEISDVIIGQYQGCN